jgi:hypothetical protein
VKRARDWFSLALTLQIACADLTPLELEVCGNGVREAGEVCDSFAIGETPCRPASDQLPCTLDCSSASCPAGYACGVDATCRRASGRFEFSSQVPASGSLAAGDFDCDGYDALIVTDDLAGPSTSVPRLLSPWPQPSLTSLGYPVSQTTILPAPNGRCDDVIGPWTTAAPLSARSGLLVLEGVELSGLVPRAELSLGVAAAGTVFAVRRNSLETEGSPMFLASDEGQGQLTLADLTEAPRVVAIAPRGPEALAAPPFVSRLPEAPCERVFLAYADPPSVWWIDPCDEKGSWQDEATGELSELPIRAALSGAMAADLDGDGATDLVASTDDGRFWWRTLDLEAADAEWREFSLQVEAPLISPGRLLASANPEGGEAILVTQRFLLRGTLVGSSFVGQTIRSRVLGSWSQARVDDFDGDDLSDVALATAGARDVELLRWVAGAQPPNPEVITTTGVVEQLVVGDFDGDQQVDLTTLEEATAADLTKRLDLMLYRGGSYDFSDGLLVGSFGLGARATSARADRDDSIADLIVVRPTETGSEARVLFGDGGGIPLSPLRLGGTTTAGALAAPLLATVRAGSTPELLVLGFDLETAAAGAALGLWRSARLETGAWEPLTRLGSLEGIAFDLAARDPTLALATDANGSTWVLGNDASATGRLRATNGGTAAWTNEWTDRWQPEVGALMRGSALAVANGVVQDRLAALAVGSDKASLALLRTDTSEDPVVLDDALKGEPRAVAWLADAQGSSSLLVATSAGIEQLMQEEDDGWSGEVVVAGDFLSLAVGDWDGDGVLDLAAATKGAVEIYEGVPEVPR